MKRILLSLLVCVVIDASILPNVAPGMWVTTNVVAVEFGGEVWHHSAATFVAAELSGARQVTLKLEDGWVRTVNVDELAQIRSISILVFPTRNKSLKASITVDGDDRVVWVPLERFQSGPVTIRGRAVRQ